MLQDEYIIIIMDVVSKIATNHGLNGTDWVLDKHCTSSNMLVFHDIAIEL